MAETKTPSQIYGDLLAGDKMKITFSSDIELATFKNRLSVAKHREQEALRKAGVVSEAKQKLIYQIKQIGSKLEVLIFLQEVEPTYVVETVTDDN